MENSKKIDNDCQQGMVFGEKELHCLSRTLQAFQLEAEHVVEGEMQCMYCKYSFECRDEFFKRHKAPYMTLLKKLERITGVDVYLSEETMHRDILSSSWIEEHPDLKESFLGMSLKEQMSRLENPDILKYRSE